MELSLVELVKQSCQNMQMIPFLGKFSGKIGKISRGTFKLISKKKHPWKNSQNFLKESLAWILKKFMHDFVIEYLKKILTDFLDVFLKKCLEKFLKAFLKNRKMLHEIFLGRIFDGL